MDYQYGAGAVKIIPASALRDVYQTNQNYDYQEGHPGAFYMGGVYNPAYFHEPYGHNAYIDPYDAHNYYPYYHQNYPGAYGYGHTSHAYRPYPQPQPSPPARRSRTAPSRQPQAATRSSRGISVDVLERRQPASNKVFTRADYNNKKTTMYRKRREPVVGGNEPVAHEQFANRHLYTNENQQQQQTLRRMRPFYAPSYTTYPPSIMQHPKRQMNKKSYPIFARIVLKLAELMLGAAVIGLVLGPMKGLTFYDFVSRTNTEWQGLVLGIAVIFSIFAAALLLTSCLANYVHFWRKVDGLITAFGCFFWLLAGFVEAYFAACYPPNGPKLNLVCHRTEWIIACIIAYINCVIYIIDFSLSWMAGVSML